jgi:hypothetical protein
MQRRVTIWFRKVGDEKSFNNYVIRKRSDEKKF